MRQLRADEHAVLNAGRFMAEAGCDAIKLEGGAEMASLIAELRSVVAELSTRTGVLGDQLEQVAGSQHDVLHQWEVLFDESGEILRRHFAHE